MNLANTWENRMFYKLHKKYVNNFDWLTAQDLYYCEFTLWTYLWTQFAFFKKISMKETSVAKDGHEKWMDCGDEIPYIPAIDQHITACFSYVFL